MRKQFTALFVMSLVSACASRADNIQASYVSTMEYQNYSCKQLAEEARAISARATEVSGQQNSKATGDAVATGVAIVVFWPAAFLISGNGTTAADLAQIKRRIQALESASRIKNCNIQFERAQPAS